MRRSAASAEGREALASALSQARESVKTSVAALEEAHEALAERSTACEAAEAALAAQQQAWDAAAASWEAEKAELQRAAANSTSNSEAQRLAAQLAAAQSDALALRGDLEAAWCAARASAERTAELEASLEGATAAVSEATAAASVVAAAMAASEAGQGEAPRLRQAVQSMRAAGKAREMLLLTRNKEAARLTDEVRQLREELAALRSVGVSAGGHSANSSPRAAVARQSDGAQAQARVAELEGELAATRALVSALSLDAQRGEAAARAAQEALQSFRDSTASSSLSGAPGGDAAARCEVARLQDELAVERAAASNVSRAFADELMAVQRDADAAHRALEGRVETERSAAAQHAASAVKALSHVEALTSENARLRSELGAIAQLRAEVARLQMALARAQAGGQGLPSGAAVPPPGEPADLHALRAVAAADAKRVAELTATRDALSNELTACTEAAAGRIGQLQRALASAANHTAGAEVRWAAEKEALLGQGERERERLRAELSAARSAASESHAGVSAAVLQALPEEQRKRLTLEMDVRLAGMAKQAADGARKLAATERERRRLADENAQLREAARASSLFALLGVDPDALACAPAAALDDVVTQGQALGALLASRVEAAVYDGVATLAGSTGITYASVEAATSSMAGQLRAVVGEGGLAATAAEATGPPAKRSTQY